MRVITPSLPNFLEHFWEAKREGPSTTFLEERRRIMTIEGITLRCTLFQR